MKGSFGWNATCLAYVEAWEEFDETVVVRGVYQKGLACLKKGEKVIDNRPAAYLGFSYLLNKSSLGIPTVLPLLVGG